MHQNIKNKHYSRLDAKLFNQKYYDFMLYKGETACDCAENIEDMAIADFSDFDFENGKWYSSIQWSGSTNNGVEMHDIGMTGIDNGFIYFDKDRITDDDFLNIFFNTTYNIESGDTRLFLSPIRSNTKLYSYDSEIVKSGDTKYMSLKGGFYQGFFKLFGHDYQVLPDRITKDVVLHFDLRPRTDYDIAENSVNNTHSGNTGIFFYMGTRAENKFWKLYSNEETIPTPEEDTDSYFPEDYVEEAEEKCNSIDGSYTDSDGNPLNQQTEYIIKDSDNKFLVFNRTETGFTVDNWIEGIRFRLKGKKKNNINYFPWLNRTETGFTIDNIDELIENIDELEGKTEEEIIAEIVNNVLKDVKNNVFALRITPDGAIGYRYGILDCDAENHYSVIEEYSKPGIIENDKWNSVNVRFAILNPTDDKCDTRPRKMKIMIYVNGLLKFISKELTALSFKELDEVYQRQEGVPYNISLGGGSIGLMETLFARDCDVERSPWPIEQDFCGTFIGDIKAFKMYLGFIDYCAIKNYLS